MNISKRIGIVAAVVLLGGVAWVVWLMAGFHVDEPRGPISAAQAKAMTGLTLPAEATYIRAASYGQWIESATYLRFEAPTDVCLRYATTLVSSATLEPADEWALKNGGRLLRPEAFDDFGWFDLANAKDVVTAGGGPSVPKVWVDCARGVFYYRLTD